MLSWDEFDKEEDGEVATTKGANAGHATEAGDAIAGKPAPTIDRVGLRMCDNAHHFEPTPEST
ncbi:hypothetical protein B5P22_03455 [Pseudomonas tolaasii]|uniref:hypothetical protein n=1 Tax=Pseudomonas tolaasii TaxID=29442 RepID=UPI0009B66C6A|nr:hypothetical protein [Pseudomonas tolaasii]ARB26380.1 hypothetical protein B5P22_03455 [Pseudomonas tolaasii]